MSDAFKTLLHERATSVAFKPPDLDGIARAGGRRLRRRRIAAAVAAAAVVASAGTTTAVLVTGGAQEHPTPLPASPWPAGTVSWATGTTIHVDSGAGIAEIEVGHEVSAFVRTATGFVVVDATDAVYSLTQAGVARIGQLNDSLPDNTDVQRLVVNSGGTLVGWVDESALPGQLAVRVYDPLGDSTRDIPAPLTTPDIHALPGVQLFAIDDRTAYWRAYDGVHAVDLDTGGDRLIFSRGDARPGDAIYSFEVYSAAQGVLAFSPDDDRTILVGPSVEAATEIFNFSEVPSELPEPEPGEAEIITGHADPVRLSPTGAWLSFTTVQAVATPVGEPAEGDAEFGDWLLTPTVLDAATGEQVALAIPDDPALVLASVWLDDGTLQVVRTEAASAQPGAAPSRVAFYECTLPDGACLEVAEIGPPVAAPFVPVFPDGRWYGRPADID